MFEMSFASSMISRVSTGSERWRSHLLSIPLGWVSRGLLLRDRMFRVTQDLRRHESREEFFFASGDRRLAGVFVPGEDGEPVILICHGIGETVGHWSGVQALLREHGVGSMVFNYSGYGASSGKVRSEHCDEDLVFAYAELRRRVRESAQVFVLGFSLGSGIAGSGVAALEPQPDGLLLCEAFSSFKDAVCAAGFPGWLARELPNVWNTVEAMKVARLPVCVVHSDGDRLFPLEMPRKIVASCGEWGELIVIAGLSHNEAYLKPTEMYWGPVVDWVRGCSQEKLCVEIFAVVCSSPL